MEITTSARNRINYITLLLLLPAAWFLGIHMLNEAGIHGPYILTDSWLQNLGIRDDGSCNLILLIVSGPVIAFFLSACQVVHIEWYLSKEQLEFQVLIRRKKFPLMLAIISSSMLVILFIFLLKESFVHH